MEKDRTITCVSVAELLDVIQKEASQLEEAAKALEGTYTRHMEYCDPCDPSDNETVTTTVTYAGLEYSEKQGIRVILKFQTIYNRDIDGKVSKNTVRLKYKMKDLQYIVGVYKNVYKKI